MRPSIAGDLAMSNTMTTVGPPSHTSTCSKHSSTHEQEDTVLDGPAAFNKMPSYVQLLTACWHQDHAQRPEAAEVCMALESMLQGRMLMQE
jgi:hypothetical protein